MIEVAIQAAVTLFGVQPSHRPRAAESSSHGTATMANIPSSVPPTLARNASINSPRTRWAHDVVIPQTGHRWPDTTRNVHGGKPNRWWVP
jgi:hypothetical protein